MNQFKENPEEFIVKAAALINDEKATAIIEHITYNVRDDRYGTDIMQLRLIEESKIHCAREHFKAIFGENVVYGVADSYQALSEKVMR